MAVGNQLIDPNACRIAGRFRISVLRPGDMVKEGETMSKATPGHSENAENLSGGDLPIRSLLSDLLRDRQAF